MNSTMKVIGSLLLMVVFACTFSDVYSTRASNNDEKALDESKRTATTFLRVLKCARPDMTTFKLLGYGCYCGVGGKGRAVDGFDNCCRIHDHCYNRILATRGCRMSSWRLYFLGYKTYSCRAWRMGCKRTSAYSRRDWSRHCRVMKCRCDYQMSQCIRYQEWNRRYQRWPQSRC